MTGGVLVSYDMRYKVEFIGPARGHHMFKETWCPQVEGLVCHRDDQEKAIIGKRP